MPKDIKKSEANRRYYEKHRGLKPRKGPAKSSTECMREFRARKKTLLNAAYVNTSTECFTASDYPSEAKDVVATFVRDPLSIKFEPKHPKEHEDCVQDQLQREYLNFGTQCELGNAEDLCGSLAFAQLNESNPIEETENACFDLAIDPLSFELDHPPKNEETLKQEVCIWDPLQQKIEVGNQDTQYPTGNAGDLFVVHVDLAQVQLAASGCNINPGNDVNPINNVWSRQTRLGQSSLVSNTQNKLRNNVIDGRSYLKPQEKAVCDVSKPSADLNQAKSGCQQDFKSDKCERFFTTTYYPCPTKVNGHQTSAEKKFTVSKPKFFRSNEHSRNEPGYIRCNRCDMSLKTACHLRFHQLAAHKDVMCTKCGMTFVSSVNHMKHMHHYHSKTTKEKSFRCKRCPKKFKDEYSFNTEVRCTTSALVKHFSCKTCHKTFHSRFALSKHLVTHPGRPRVTCTICEAPFIDEMELRLHQCWHTYVLQHSLPKLSSQYCYDCKQCSKKLYSNAARVKHEKKHTDEKVSKLKVVECQVQCHLCPKTLSSKAALELHVSRHACKKCDLTFPSVLARQSHICTHNGVDTKQYTCDVCGKMLGSKTEVRAHMAIHFPVQGIKCSLTSQTIVEKKNQKHMQAKHVIKLNYKCKICGAAFAEKAERFMHKLIYSSKENSQQTTVLISDTERIEEIYNCFFCAEEFTHLESLNAHLQANHDIDMDKDYACDVCGSTFRTKKYLKIHWLQHITDLKEARKRFFLESDTKSSIETNADKISCTPTGVAIVHPEAGSFVTQTQNLPVVKIPNSIMPMSALSNVCLDSKNDPLGNEVLDEFALAKVDIQPPDQKISQNKPSFSQVTPAPPECIICFKWFSTDMELESHYESHWELKLSQREAELFKKRLKTHGIGSYTCHVCNEKFFVSDKFKQHLKAQILNSFGKLSCPISHREAHFGQSIKSGINNALIGNLKIYECRFCNAAFTAKRNFSVHEQTHGVEEVDPFADISS